MSSKIAEPLPKIALGVNFHHSDGQNLSPNSKRLEASEVENWLFSFPELNDGINYKILAVKVDSTSINAHKSYRPPLPHKLIEHAIWQPDVYYHLAQNPSGGAAALLDEPVRFILQTPLDGGPFCSLAMSKIGSVVKGIYTYDCDDFEPSLIGKGERSLSGWRSRGFQIVNMPQAILRAHSTYISKNVAEVIDEVKAVEAALAASEHADVVTLSETLHACNGRIIDLERRSRFEQTMISAIETVVSNSRDGSMPWTAIAPQKSALEARGFDFESLPRRIDNARMHITTLAQQRNARMNLEIADASRRLTQIALSDNASMKTIAVLTMVFLPGTAVASFFSMAMFNWSSKDGSNIASKWIWVYFVVAVPLTALVLTAWWILGVRGMRQRFNRQYWWNDLQEPRPGVEDVELSNQRIDSLTAEDTEIVLPDK